MLRKGQRLFVPTARRLTMSSPPLFFTDWRAAWSALVALHSKCDESLVH